MDIEDKNKFTEDEKMRRLLRTSKLRASENFSWRVMQQIETEKALTARRRTSKRPGYNVFTDTRSIFGSMYAVLLAMVALAYFEQGKEVLLTPDFLGKALLVGVG
ncbi:MAG TPA: hypothetical protein DEF88_07900, partial [Porphyromonadaceae bacterium]|nr:hypothetical protein [Porphyromonadaceae bacterium]